MRVLHVDSGREWRGGQTQLLYLARASPGEVHVALPPGAPVASALEAVGCTVHAADLRGAFLGTRRLRALVAALQPDLLAAHTSHAHAHAARCADLAPVVVHRRVDFALKVDPLARRKYLRPAGYVAVSGAVARVLAAGGVPADRVRVVHDGVDAAPFDAAERDRAGVRAELGLSEPAPLVLAVGALVAHKDHATLVRAAAALPASVTVAIAGEGPLRPALEAQLAGQVGGARVVLLGQRSDVPRLLRAADVVCHSSEEEGMGQSVVEAMLCGAPVVATAAGGVPEVVVDGVTGRVVAVHDHAGLARELAALLDGPAEVRRALGAAGRARALAQFSVEQMVLGTLAAYAELGGARWR